MGKSAGTPIRIATAGGPGAGRFLARAMLDALESGARFTHIRWRTSEPRRSCWAVDFVLARPAFDGSEVVRAELDARGVVTGGELLRDPQAPEHRRLRCGRALLEALREGHALVSVRMVGPAGSSGTVQLCLEGGRSFAIDLADFSDIAGDF